MSEPLPSTTPGEDRPPPGWATRFSWPMRIFLLLFLFDMFARDVLTLTPCDGWQEEFDVATYPQALPTVAECGQLMDGSDGGQRLAGRFGECLQSAARHLTPWPTAAERERIDSPAAAGRYAGAWIAARCRFVGKVVGIDHGWPMFSPSVARTDTVARMKLIYADGTSEVYHSWCDPPDLTHYSRWWHKRPLHVAARLHSHETARLGFSNWLVHHRGANDAGSPLVRIDYYKIEFEYTPPDADAAAYLAEQTAARADLVEPPFWSYDVATKTGTWNR